MSALDEDIYIEQNVVYWIIILVLNKYICIE